MKDITAHPALPDMAGTVETEVRLLAVVAAAGLVSSAAAVPEAEGMTVITAIPVVVEGVDPRISPRRAISRIPA
jgi:hypothetical protein